MEQNNNIENQFRQKLSQRTVEPSDKAWDRLDAMLSVSEKKKSKRTWLWFAASLVVFATIGSLFLKTDNSELIMNDELQITERKFDETNYELQNANPTKSITSDEIITEHLTKLNSNDNSNFNNNNENTEIVSTDIETNIDIEAVEKEEKTTEKIHSNKYISVENLLAQIEKDKTPESRKLHPKVKIDANTLLTSTIKEMDEEHQDKALNNFKHQFQNIKEAFVNRNKE